MVRAAVGCLVMISTRRYVAMEQRNPGGNIEGSIWAALQCVMAGRCHALGGLVTWRCRPSRRRGAQDGTAARQMLVCLAVTQGSGMRMTAFALGLNRWTNLGEMYSVFKILDKRISSFHDDHMEASSFPRREKSALSATLTVRHTVADYATRRAAYESVAAFGSTHRCTAAQVFRAPGNPHDVFATHDFPSVEQASAFAADRALAAAMRRGGVASELRIEIFERA